MWSRRIWAGACFAWAAVRYWAIVFPAICRELRGWRARASAMPDPALRALALEAAGKRGNMEGAAIFATFAPRRGRRPAISAAVAFQAAYNYLDVVGEQPCGDAVTTVARLHGALVAALRPGAPHLDYYGALGVGGDGGYLTAMVEGCRDALAALPSGAVMAQTAREAAERVVAFQALNLAESNGSHAQLAAWGMAQTPPDCDLAWWEIGASAGSSLGVHVLLAAAARPTLCAAQARALDRAYFPWIGALHSLLDNLVDVDEDARTGQRNLASYYGDPRKAALQMRRLAQHSRREADALPGSSHRLVLAAMTALYMSDPQARVPRLAPARAEILSAVGLSARAALSVFAARRTLSAMRRRARAAASRAAGGQVVAGQVAAPRGTVAPRGTATPPQLARLRGEHPRTLPRPREVAATSTGQCEPALQVGGLNARAA
jgi:tetraprenyl-beta-curcumene synthase